jgi:hypothetical protein
MAASVWVHGVVVEYSSRPVRPVIRSTCVQWYAVELITRKKVSCMFHYIGRDNPWDAFRTSGIPLIDSAPFRALVECMISEHVDDCRVSGVADSFESMASEAENVRELVN